MAWKGFAGALPESSGTDTKKAPVSTGAFSIASRKSSEDEDQDEDYQNEGSYSDVHSCSFLIKSGLDVRRVIDGLGGHRSVDLAVVLLA